MYAIVKIRKLGGSLIATIPSEIVQKLNLNVNETIEVDVKLPKKSFFGLMKNLSEFREGDRFDRE